MNERKIAVFGKITDFEGNPLQDATVEIKNDRFEAIYKTRTNVAGQYRLYVKKGLYMALIAYKDYKTKYLEYWAWNVPLYQDLQIDPRIGGIEVYALNAFRPQGAYPSLLIYFRPMSLKRFQRFQDKNTPKRTGVIDISPVLSEDDIEVRINKKTVKILELNQVKEYAGGIDSMIAYLAQLTLPKKSLIAYFIQAALPFKQTESKENSAYFRIDVLVKDPQTEEKGEGCLFWTRKHAENTGAVQFMQR